MNISLVNTFDNVGGAAIAAFRLFKGLRAIKLNASMIVANKKSNHPNVYKALCSDPEFGNEQMVSRNIQRHEIENNRSGLSNTRFTFPYSGYDLSRTKIIADSDLINLHWISDFQSVETISSLMKLNKPVVWTLHDEFPYTGGCHYTAGCMKYREECLDCLQLNKKNLQLPYHVLQNKINLWNGNLTIVSPSKWLAENARKSRVFKNLRIEVIPNSLETEVFKPQAKELAKSKLGIDPRTITLLFGAYTGFEKRKGFAELLAAIKLCLKNPEFKKLDTQKRIKIITYGPPQKDLKKLDIEIKSTGFKSDASRLSPIYSAADIFILPSLEDNLPNTMLEAMSCGTPVIGFDTGGIPDMVKNGITGYTSPRPDINKLSDAILKLISEKELRKQMGINCRRLIEQKYKLSDQAENYSDLFKELLRNKKEINVKRENDHMINDVQKNGKVYIQESESVLKNQFSANFPKYIKENRYIKNNTISWWKNKILKSFLYPNSFMGRLISLQLKRVYRFYKKK